jgi:HPt (histidine-containing phosphotransfer) domain-containing protein
VSDAGQAAIRARLADLIEDDDPDDRAFVAAMVRSFVDRAPGLLAELDAALAAGDADLAAHWVHALKGAASNVGADAVARLCADLERRARAAGLGPLRGGRDDVGAALTAAERDLTAVLATL